MHSYKLLIYEILFLKALFYFNTANNYIRKKLILFLQ